MICRVRANDHRIRIADCRLETGACVVSSNRQSAIGNSHPFRSYQTVDTCSANNDVRSSEVLRTNPVYGDSAPACTGAMLATVNDARVEVDVPPVAVK